MVKYILTILLTLTFAAANAQVQMMFTKDSLSGITSPADLDSLFYWFAADVAVYDSLGGAIANNEGVGTWTDLSGNGYDVTMDTNTYRPVWKATGGPGGKPCIQFDGTNDYLRSVAHFWGSDDLTIFVVYKHADAGLNQQESIIARLETPTDKRQFVLFGREDAVSNRNQLNTYESGTGTPSINGYYGQKSTIFKLMSITKLSTSASFNWYEDGVTQSLTYASGPTAPIFNDATNKTSIGAVNVQSTPANFFQGSISEIIVTTDALSTAQRTAIENYLNKKYDLY